MHYDFDKEISRKGTNCVKWEFSVQGGSLIHWEQTDPALGDERVLPMWVADMDFRAPQPVIDALVARAAHGIFGYTAPTQSYYTALVDWMQRRQGWRLEPEWICTTPGVVPALNLLVRTFVAPGEKVLIQPPVYHPFYRAITNNEAQIARNPLVLDAGRYCMDFDDLAHKLEDPAVKLAILCNPHNPVGRVWTREELGRFAELCLAHDVLVVSDEIHGDLIYPGHQFTPYACLGDAALAGSIICTAPSKTFNLAGLATSNIVIASPELRLRFQKTLATIGLHGINTFGLTATEAAYCHGDEWLDQVMAYITDNYGYLESTLRQRLPQIDAVRPEGTYLVWLDCRKLGLDRAGLERLVLEQARIYPDQGYIFGDEGEGFLRLNIACPRSILVEALQRLEAAVAQLAVSR